MACRVRSMPSDSMVSLVSRRPAVSISRKRKPSMMIRSSMVSRVVPAISLTMALSSPTRALSKVDLPALVGPTIATRIPFLMALPVWKEVVSAVSRSWMVSASVLSSVRSANSSSSWSAKSSSSSMRLVKWSSWSRSVCSSDVMPPLSCVSARSFSALVSAAMRSATASACVRSILPLRNARCVNSPG